MPDIHSGLHSETLDQHKGAGVTFTRAKITHGRDSVTYGIHGGIYEHFLGGGLDRDDFLGRLGFTRHRCPFSELGEAYCIEVGESFDLETFAAAFALAFDSVREADQHLQRCGFFIQGRDIPATRWTNTRGDGHTGSAQERMKESADAHFRFVFSWLKGADGQGGWTTHYRAQEQPMSAEMQSVFDILGLRTFRECIEFEFERCYWRNVSRTDTGRGPFSENNSAVHGWFDAHPEHFSPGLERLLNSDALMRPFGFAFLPLPGGRGAGVEQPARAARPEARRVDARVTLPPIGDEPDDDFDVAISFAGLQREQAEELATILREKGVQVFYDRFFGAQLWGKHLPEYFDTIYRKRSRFCVMFVSAAYRDGVWTTHERRSALARAVDDKGREYILPIKVEDVDLDGIPPTVGYVSIAEYTILQIADMLIEKLGEAPSA